MASDKQMDLSKKVKLEKKDDFKFITGKESLNSQIS